jgi:hypothetical protein
VDFNKLISLESSCLKDLNDIIELNDGTRIESVILEVDNDGIEYLNARTECKERIHSNAIKMVHIENAGLSIPFPLTVPTAMTDQSRVQNQIDLLLLQNELI